MQSPYTDFINSIIGLLRPLSDALIPLGIPFGPLAWFVIIVFTPFFLATIVLAIRGRRSGGGSANVTEAVQKVVASTGDVSGGMAGTKKLKYLKKPGDALVFLKVEENAIQQALTAIAYYAQQGDIDEAMKDRLIATYQGRIDAVRAAIAKDEELKAIVEVDDAVDKARSDYLKKLAAMSGTEVESDTEKTGPSSVGMPGTTTTGPSTTASTPTGGAPGDAGASNIPPGGGTPSSGPPGGSAPSGGPPGSVTPSGGPPGGGPPGGAAPSGGPPGGGTPSLSSGPPGVTSTGGSPGGAPPGGGISSSPPGGGLAGTPGGAPAPTGGKSSLQSEMLAEMERLKALMSGD